ncbi:unnamed protein product [Albugo candida]|uniref:Chromo domain-containing protein n=1 Tax=Albugo candida TaxID=65357 RepID=A0A024GSU5_9STRA|nr:unnamed protein product [Albugo candida]|eukprot:CCI49982.1 unnamed protein product [Albugo candida]
MKSGILLLETCELHASRLKFNADSDLNVSWDFCKMVAHDFEGHVVDKFRGHRFLRASARYELLVSWRGLMHADDSWKTAAALHQDVPVLVKGYCILHQAYQLVAKSLGINIPESNVASQPAAEGIPAQAREPLINQALTKSVGIATWVKSKTAVCLYFFYILSDGDLGD